MHKVDQPLVVDEPSVKPTGHNPLSPVLARGCIIPGSDTRQVPPRILSTPSRLRTVLLRRFRGPLEHGRWRSGCMELKYNCATPRLKQLVESEVQMGLVNLHDDAHVKLWIGNARSGWACTSRSCLHKRGTAGKQASKLQWQGPRRRRHPNKASPHFVSTTPMESIPLHETMREVYTHQHK